MAPPRTEADLTAAIDSMFRIRAVESPPDEAGERTIWHRGTRGADLVSWVDSTGVVVRQELSLFEEVVQWQRGVGLKTGLVSGEASLVPKAKRVDLHAQLDRAVVERLAQAVARYKGNDRFIGHLRDQMHAWTGEFSFEAEAVTRPATRVREELEALQKLRSEHAAQRKGRIGLIAIGAGLALIIAAALVLIMK